jgi:hypothetical protein
MSTRFETGEGDLDILARSGVRPSSWWIQFALASLHREFRGNENLAVANLLEKVNVLRMVAIVLSTYNQLEGYLKTNVIASNTA